MGTALILLAVVSVVALTVFILRLDRTIDCHERYIDAFKTANLERAAAAAEDRDANRDLFVAAAQQAGNRQAQLEAFNEWLRRLEAADQRRSEHPLPTERCG